MGAVSGYSIGRDMANLSVDEIVQMSQTEGILEDATSGTAVSIRLAEDPGQASLALQTSGKKLPPPKKAVAAVPSKRPDHVERKTETQGLEREFDQRTKAFAKAEPLMGNSAERLKDVWKKTLALSSDATSDKPGTANAIRDLILEASDGDPTKASKMFLFLLENTPGDLRDSVEIANKIHFEENGDKIKKGQDLENIAKSVSGGVEEFKGQEGKTLNLYEKFNDFVAMEADTQLLDDQLLHKVSHEEAGKILDFFKSSAGKELRKGEMGPQTVVLIKHLKAIQGYNGVHANFEKRFKGLTSNYKLGISNHLKNMRGVLTELKKTPIEELQKSAAAK